MITAPLLSMFVVPVVYLLLRRRQVCQASSAMPMREEKQFGTA
jgi:Cu(I)/Ag(I) efflux system membrane protein CusA/SilA